MNLTRRLLAVALLAHLAVQVALVRAPRFFASEDDGYRLYQAYLLCSGQADPIGRFWLPGQLALTCPALAAGVPPVWAGLAVSMLGLVLLALALAALTRRLAGDGQGEQAGGAALVLVLASPMAATLSHSALAELPAMAACALAALGLLARAQGAPISRLLGGTAAMLLATWIRYESWPLAALYPIAAGLAAGAGGQGQGRWRWRDALVASLAWLGPLAWLLLQWQHYGDPLAFLHATADITAQAGHAGVARVLAHRLWALVTWAPVPLLGGIVAALLIKRRAPFVFLAWMALGVILPALGGDEHPTFPARLAFGLEVGLVPLAALALARAAGARAPRPFAALALLLVVLAPLVLARTRRPGFLDRDSVVVGLALRNGRLAPPAHGTLLVERPEARPPLGWASLASAWAEWSRIVFATPQAGTWELVMPTDVLADRWHVGDADLGAWLDAHAVSAAWCVTPTCVKTLRVLWPEARVREIGRGRWLTRLAPP